MTHGILTALIATTLWLIRQRVQFQVPAHFAQISSGLSPKFNCVSPISREAELVQFTIRYARSGGSNGLTARSLALDTPPPFRANASKNTADCENHWEHDPQQAEYHHHPHHRSPGQWLRNLPTNFKRLMAKGVATKKYISFSRRWKWRRFFFSFLQLKRNISRSTWKRSWNLDWAACYWLRKVKSRFNLIFMATL